MNKRIKKLIKQATVLEDDELFVRETLDVEKFVELIIKETLTVARAGMEYGPSMDEVVYGYFGIKE